MKKLTRILLVAIMFLSLSMTSLAATVVVQNNVSDHVFKAYCLFTGTQQEGQATLGNVAWDDDVNATTLLAELKEKSDLYDACTTAVDVAKVLASYADNSTEAKKFAKIAYNHVVAANGVTISSATTSLADGYYLIVDVTEVEAGDSYNAALLQVTGKENIVIGLKKDQPTVVKKIKENGQLIDVTDASMGDTVEFVITSVVPDMTHYDTYEMVFHETVAEGFDVADDVQITIGTGASKVVLTKDVDFKVVSSNDCSFEIVIEDLKAIENIAAGQDITVTYTAALDNDAEVGLPGNDSVTKLEYSNNPNNAQATGFTTTDQVVVFTYELAITKVDGSDNSVTLSDAEFVLYRLDGTAKEYAVVVDGKISDWTADESAATVLVSGRDGAINVAGIDAGTYYLEEKNSPAGYNLLADPVEFTITASLATGEWETAIPADAFTKLEITVPDGDNATDDTTEGSTDGTVSMIVENNQGSLLPETGGVGTTIFYLVGAVLVLGAGILLFVRKRVEK